MTMKKRKTQFRLDLHFYYDRFLATSDSITALHSLLISNAPTWMKRLHIWVDGKTPLFLHLTDPSDFPRAIQREAARRGILYHELQEKFGSPKVRPRTFGIVELRGADESLILIVSIDEDKLFRAGEAWRWGNYITVQVCQTQVEDTDAVAWSWDFFREMVRKSAPVYAHAEITEEYKSKNIAGDSAGIRAVGLDVSRGLPGIYWLNAFGPPYVEMMGRQKLLTSPAPVVDELRDCIFIGLSSLAGHWTTLEYKKAEAAVIEHLGKHYFFSKDDPDRPLLAPDFGISR
jgi:hypothetical protein